MHAGGGTSHNGPNMPRPGMKYPGASGASSSSSGSPAVASNSLAFLVARTVTSIPVLVVKHNSAGRFAFGGNQAKSVGGHVPLSVCIHLEILAVSVRKSLPKGCLEVGVAQLKLQCCPATLQCSHRRSVST